MDNATRAQDATHRHEVWLGADATAKAEKREAREAGPSGQPEMRL